MVNLTALSMLSSRHCGTLTLSDENLNFSRTWLSTNGRRSINLYQNFRYVYIYELISIDGDKASG